jgi:hypothetical protein
VMAAPFAPAGEAERGRSAVNQKITFLAGIL